MSDGELSPLSVEELAEIDAEYAPFPAFAEWPQQVPEMASWDTSSAQLQETASTARSQDLDKAREIAMRAAAFDTGAIEGLYSTNRGLTFTVAEQLTAWEQEVAAQGDEARALFEAQLKALELVLDHATSRLPEITQAWVRRLHEEITSPQETYQVYTPVGTQRQPLPRGEYKSNPNHVRTADGGVHAYAPVEQTHTEMQRLMEELNSPEFLNAHPVAQASYAHYALVAVHPFADGNGRVARALASVYTYRAASVPLLVFLEERKPYFKALAAADEGKAEGFVRFVGKVAVDTLSLVIDNLQTAMSPQPDEVINRLDDLVREQRAYKARHESAIQLVGWIAALIKQQIDELEAEDKLDVKVEERGKPDSAPPEGYRQIPSVGPKSVRIFMRSLAPLNVNLVVDVDLFVEAGDRPKSLLIHSDSPGSNEDLELPFEEVTPTLSSVAQRRIENYLRRNLGRSLSAIYDVIARNLNSAQKSIRRGPPRAVRPPSDRSGPGQSPHR